MYDYVVTFALFFLGGIVQGCMGFGLAMIVAPPMLLFMPATMVVPAMTLTSLLNTAAAAWSLRQHMQPRIVGPLAVGSFLGLPLGIYLLASLDGPVFKTGVGALMVILAILLLSGWRWQLRHPQRALLPVGFTSGFLGGSISISGPPIVLFLSNLGITRDQFRANSLGYFTLNGIMALTGFAISGLLTREAAAYALYLIPAVFLGTQAGLFLAPRLGQVLFQRITLGAVAVMGFILFARSLYDLV